MPEFVRSSGRIIRTILSAKERQAVTEEASKLVREVSRDHEKEELAIVAWQLHNRLKWGEKRISDFLRDYYIDLRQLNTYYQFEKTDTPWLCSKKLKDNGIDWDKLYDSIKGEA